MAFGADAAVAPAARHIVREHARRHAPRRVLRICQRIHVDDRRADGGGDVHGPAVVRNQQRRRREQRRHLAEIQGAGKRERRRAHLTSHRCDERSFIRRAGQDDTPAVACSVRLPPPRTTPADNGAMPLSPRDASRTTVATVDATVLEQLVDALAWLPAALRATAGRPPPCSRRWRRGRAAVAPRGGRRSQARSRAPSR